MTILIYKTRLILVPAVAVRRVSLVLVIFIRYKGYLDIIYKSNLVDMIEFLYRGTSIISVEMKFVDTK